MQGVYGTSFFIAPEVIEHNYSEKCDIWSIGVILYMLIAGRPPFDGHTDQEIVKAILNGKYDLDSEVWNHMSAELKDLISKMLCREPKRLTAKEVLHHPWFEICSK